jgi:hypothetical protein
VAHKEQLLAQMREAALVIEHGYDGITPGYIAQAVAVEFPGFGDRIMTAAHNVVAETVVVVNPSTKNRIKQSFVSYTPEDAPDTGVSRHPYGENLGKRKPLKAGEMPEPGDEIIILVTRHIGNGELQENIIEGTMAGKMVCPHDNYEYPFFNVTSGEALFGDSGGMVVPLTRNGIPQTKAELVGVYHAGSERGRISPVPQQILEQTRQVSDFYRDVA